MAPTRSASTWSASSRGRSRARSGIGPSGLHRERPTFEVGRLGLGRRPDRLEAVPLLGCGSDRLRDGVGDRLGRALEVRRVRGDRDRFGEGHPKPAIGSAGRDRRQDPGGCLGGQRGRPRGQRGPRVEQLHRDPVAAIAPVDQQAEQLAAAQDAEDRSQVAPRDERRVPLLALCAQVLEQLGKGRVVGDDVQWQAHVGDRSPDDVVVADMSRRDDERHRVSRLGRAGCGPGRAAPSAR